MWIIKAWQAAITKPMSASGRARTATATPAISSPAPNEQFNTYLQSTPSRFLPAGGFLLQANTHRRKYIYAIARNGSIRSLQIIPSIAGAIHPSRHCEPVRTLAWQSVCHCRGGSLTLPLNREVRKRGTSDQCNSIKLSCHPERSRRIPQLFRGFFVAKAPQNDISLS